VSDVARGLRLQTSNVSNTVRHLVERGLLERASDPRDQRRVLLRLTELSSTHRDLLRATWASLLAGMLPDLGGRDTELLLAAAPALARLAERAATGPAVMGSSGMGSSGMG
jgi:DNA-binding MarR family transcriptional regulator